MEAGFPRTTWKSAAVPALMLAVLCAACGRWRTPPSDSQGSAASPAGGAAAASPTGTTGAGSDAGPRHAESAGAPAEGGEREALFQDWPRPVFAMFLTGQQIGYLEPCGCTGLANQMGGLARRHTFSRQLTDRGWPIVAVDVGNQIRRFGRQAEIKFQVTADALIKMGYRSIALGVDDLRLSGGLLLATTTAAGDQKTTPFVCANAAVYERSLTPTHHIVEAAGKKIGITAILGSDLQSKIISSEIQLTSPEAGLDNVLPALREAKCDVLVLLAHASLVESRQLARKYPDFHVIVTAGGTGEPTYEPEPIPESKAIMVQVGLKGTFAGVLAYFDDPRTPWRYQRVPLDSRFEDSPEMLDLLASYQKQLESVGLEGLGLSPLPHPSGHEFVGSERCGSCHTKAYAKWLETPHSHATDSIVEPPERGEIPRHFDPECLSCHVTGWNPQRFFPYTSGFLSLSKSPAMKGSGCENCHGPGSAHVAAESGDVDASEDQLLRLKTQMRLRLSDAEKKCLECHDTDNSPDFHAAGAFQDRYWPVVEHKGLD